MKINPPGLLPLLLLAAVLLSGLSVPAKAQVTFADALDAPGLQWSLSGNGRWIAKTGSLAYDGTDYVEVESARTENGDYVSAMLSTEVTGPAVVRFRWQYVSTDTDPALGVLVDGALTEIPAWALGMDGWTQLELQLSPGPHTFGFRPFWGMIARLDAFTVTPGTGLFLQSAGRSPVCWMVSHHAGAWTASAGAPPGLSGSAAWSGDGWVAWAACVLPPDFKLEGWVKATLAGCSISSNLFFDSSLYRQASPEWRRVRIVPHARWITFVSNNGEQNSVDLHLAGITAVPAGIGDVLDAPELPWTATGAPPFERVSYEFAPFGTCGWYMPPGHPFDAGFSTSLTGPGRLFFSSDGYSRDGVFWRVRTVHGTDSGSFPGGYWQRTSVSIPAGPTTAEISVVSEGDIGNIGHAYLDDVTWCIAATPGQKDALDLPESTEMWVRQSAADLWTRTTAVSRVGGDALSLAPATTARRADLVLPVAGTRLAGMWIKTLPQTELAVTRTSPAPDLHASVEKLQPVAGSDWTWTPFSTGPDVAELRFTVPPDSDEGQELYLDGYRTYSTTVSVAAALDTTGITWSGGGGLALPGSDAIGEKAVVLAAGNNVANFISMMPGGPFRMKYRYRFCDPAHYGQSLLSLASNQIPPPHESYLDPSGWREEEIVCYDVPVNAALTIRVNWGVLLLDKVEFHPLTQVSFAEALDAPAVTPSTDGGWRGWSGIGRDGVDALASPSRTGHGNSYWEMILNTPFPDSAVDGGFWWKIGDPDASRLDFRITEIYDPYAAGKFPYAGPGWQQVRFHCDRMPPRIAWYQTLGSASTLPGGEAMIDELSLNAAAQDAFSRALDTDGLGADIAPYGWSSVGSADVRAQTAVSWQDGDALEIRPVSGGPPLQSARITATLDAGTAFSCRVKRGPSSGCGLTIMHGDPPLPYAEVPLTAEWTECRVLLPMDNAMQGAPVTLLATVPGAGPDAVIYLDAVSLTPATDFNAALETTGLAWTSTGDGSVVIGGEIVPQATRSPAYNGVFDGVSFEGLARGQRRRMDTVITGPGIGVFTGYRVPSEDGGCRVRLIVDGVTKDSLPYVNPGPFFLQAFIPDGPHMVRWSVERDATGLAELSSIQLHSVALVPGLPADLLPAALESIAPGRTWVPGGSHPPAPLYSLKEGVTAVLGVHFPVSAFGETSSLETSLTGPATVGFTWISDVIAACYLDGLTASRTINESGDIFVSDPRTVMHVPAGPHTLRWASAQGVPAKLRAFSSVSGSDIAEVLAGSSPPVVWLHQPFYPGFGSWQVRTDETLLATNEDGILLEVPGTGLPVLAGSDSTSGSFWVRGPAIVSYDVRRLYYSFLAVDIDNGPARYAGGPVDLQWHPDAVLVPTGDHLVSFWLPWDAGGATPYTWLRNIRIQPGLPWITWAFGIGLVDISDSSPFADPDGDGIINLMEFAFGTQPRAWNNSAGPELTGPPENLRLQFPGLPWDATSLTYDVEVSSDLTSWNSFTTVHPNPPGQPGPSASLPSPQEGRKFYRVTVRL